jgi:CRP/FNR family transcriptional regulator, cyclic AMP receptor protein
MNFGGNEMSTPMTAALRSVHLFSGLADSELEELSSICRPCQSGPGELIVQQNTIGSEVYMVGEGSVEVFIKGLADEQVLVLLGKGQVFGEMALLDQGYRSASVRASQEGCTCYVFEEENFRALCQSNKNIGFTVMRNLASDLAFKLRHRNLAQM